MVQSLNPNIIYFPLLFEFSTHLDMRPTISSDLNWIIVTNKKQKNISKYKHSITPYYDVNNLKIIY